MCEAPAHQHRTANIAAALVHAPHTGAHLVLNSLQTLMTGVFIEYALRQGAGAES